jgi:hypothetical protein
MIFGQPPRTAFTEFLFLIVRSGQTQVYDQAPAMLSPSSTFLPSTAYWNWDDFSERNLFEVEEFRPHMPLHNVYEGQSVARDGSLSLATIDAMEDRLRGVLEECDNLRFVENFVDMDSSWAGLSLEVLTYLSEECPSAVVATFGNDWSYPLADQSDANVYSAGIESRDKSKIEARRRLNLLSSVAMLIETSSVFIPVALSSHTRRYPLHGTMLELLSAATHAATAIEIALSEFRATPSATVYNLLDGILPSMKVVELSARYPLMENPTVLVNETTCVSEPELSKWTHCSLLPRPIQNRSRPAFSSLATHTDQPPLPRFRRVHFRGDFDAHASSLQSALDRFAPQDTVLQWTREPLYMETTSTMEAVDAASQLTLSHAVGEYLHGLATQSSRSDRRILYEFTQAGMNVDAVEEYQATLRGVSEAYPSHRRATANASDDEDNA